MSRMWRNVVLSLCLIGGILPLVFVLYVNAQPRPVEVPCLPHELKKIENIERIFMERPTSYVLMRRNDGDTLKIEKVYAGRTDDVTFISDVPSGKSLWVSAIGCEKDVQNQSLEIHIRQIQDIEGVGSETRVGKGQTIKNLNVPIQ